MGDRERGELVDSFVRRERVDEEDQLKGRERKGGGAGV